MDLFHNLIYVPIYNLVVFLVDVIPGGDLGLAVIGATVVVKLILLPLSLSAVKTQKAMKVLEPELKELKEKYKDDRETQAREMLALYKKHGVKPFASILMLFIQIPILFGLYYVALHATALSSADPALLYPFVSVPTVFSPDFLGMFPLAEASLVLAAAAALAQLAQSWYTIPVPEKSAAPEPSMQEEFGRMVALQARYIFPLLVAVIAYTSSVLALYFIASSLFMVAQEFVVRSTHSSPAPAAA